MTEKKPVDANDLYSPTPYDDAFRIMEGACDDLLVSLVNYLFGESFGPEAEVIRLRNEHFSEGTDGSVQKRITDSHFSISENGVIKKYHIECESGGFDNSILIRIFEYVSQIALDEAERTPTKLRIRFPYTGLLLLNGGDNVADKAEIDIITPDGEIKYNVPIIKRKNIELDEIFNKKLYFLIPFYILNYKDKLNELEKDEGNWNDLVQHYKEIFRRLESEYKKGELPLFSLGVIIETMERVAYNMTLGHGTVNTKVGEIMGGQYKELEWIKAWREAEAKGKAEGKAEGAEEQLINMICRKLKKGKTVSQIAEELEEDEATIQSIVNTAEKYAPEYDIEKIVKDVLAPV